MLLAVLVLLHCCDSAPTYSGRERQLDVPIPRFEADVLVDGDLADSVWARAARLTGFSQYAPNDGVAAADSTQVLVWYSATAIYFGIRAFERHGRPTMTLANRDQIFDDDNVQILLGTFNDGKRALLFAVNPVGVQGDGSLIEGTNITASGFIGGAVVGREQPDLSPDFVFQSRGRMTDWGYEVEVRIPFKSLRYQPRQPQDWRLNIVRQVKHSGVEDSWFPARRASATFVGQSGNLVGLSGMHRGLVMDLNPEATGKASGAPTLTRGYRYDVGDPQVGGNVRWGVSDNLTLNGTIKPDFSQVESDAGQLAFDPRQALFFSEKRPFFLEGSELFQVPQNLIYTRRIVQPVAAVKLTGTTFGTDIGLLSAVDQQFASATGTDNPIFTILRAQRSLGRGSRVGLAYTDRIEGGDYNRVAEVDSRLVFKEIYGLNLQLAGSRTRTGGVTTTAPLWLSQFTVQHRIWGLRSVFAGISDQFRDASGFIGRAASCIRTSIRATPPTGAPAHGCSGSPATSWWTASGSTRISFTGVICRTRSCTSTVTRRCAADGTWVRDTSWNRSATMPTSMRPTVSERRVHRSRDSRRSRTANTSSRSGRRSGSISVGAGFFCKATMRTSSSGPRPICCC
ncbi:MAG TPA: DUF5916 domain-containing protein [Gemmatimonadales bacterium]|nr:DUF5916 domain-containing protein [Gemmatimonadales bacterium]